MVSIRAQVLPSQTGPDGLQTTVSVLTMMQDCSRLWFDSEPELKGYLTANGLGIFIASRQTDIVRFGRYAEELKVETGVYECNGAFGYRNTFIYGAGGEPIAKSWSIGVFVDMATGRPARLPDRIVKAGTYDQKADMEYLDRKIVLPESEPEEYPCFTAMRSDIDLYDHVNNAQYIRMACEFLPEGRKYHRVRVEYKSPAKLHDRLFPFVRRAGDAVYVELRNGAGGQFFVAEFSEPKCL